MARNYDKYRPLQAKFDSQGSCGHIIRKGDRIGYSTPRYRGEKAETQCAECWRKWSNDVANEQEYCNGF